MAGTWRCGQRIELLWRRGESWQARVLLCPATEEDYADVYGSVPPGAKESNLFFAMTPDGDIYPHVLQTPMVAGVLPYDRTGRRQPQRGAGVKRAANAAVYGEDWTPSPEEFVEALEAALGRGLRDLLA